jgi:AcrR family transcriptional regulator
MVRINEPLSHEKPVVAESGRRQRRREETTEKLFIAAIELFSRKGFARTTVEDITKAADVGKGTFFNYFPSKEHVLGYLVGKQQGTVLEHLALAREAKLASEEVLTSLGRSLIRFPGKSPELARSLIQSFLGNIEVREYIVREMSIAREWIAEIIRLGQKRGELRDEIPPPELARAFHRVLLGTALMWALDPESSMEKQFVSTMRTIFSGLNLPSKPLRAVRRRFPPEVVKRERKSR